MRVVAPGLPTASLMSGLTAYWRLNEPSGVAYSHNGLNDLTDNNTVTAVSGKLYGNARQFTSANSEFFSIADNADVSTGDVDWAIAGWVHPDTIPGTGVEYSWAAKSDGGAQDEFRVTLAGASTYAGQPAAARFGFGFRNTNIVFDTIFGTPSAGMWYFLVCRHDPTANLIYLSVNGGPEDSAATTVAGLDGTASFRFGSWQGTAQFWDGSIQGVGLWKRALTSTERALLYNNDSGLAFPFHGRTLIPGVPYSAQPMLVGAR